MSSRKRLIYDSSESDSSDSDIDSNFYNEKPIKRKRVKSKIIIKPEVKRKKIEAQIKPNKRIKTEFLPFDKALVFARSLGMTNRFEWKVWCKEGTRHPNVPSDPSKTYKDHGWQGWGHWLDSSNLKTKLFLPFAEALAVARSLNLASSTEWHAWSKEGRRPANVPSHPNQVYKDHGWQGWGHWLGTGNQSSKEFLPFEEALAVAQTLGPAGMSGSREWKAWCKAGMRPAGVPSDPAKVYKDGGWQGWGHWLGAGNLRKKRFLPFDQALVVARSLGLASQKDWYAWSKSGGRPVNVPSAPNATYKNKGWKNWQHWLGTDIVKEKPIKIKEEPHQEPIVFNTFDEEEYKELYKWVMSKSLNVNKGASSRTRSNNIQVNKRTGELIVTCLERILNKKGLEEKIRTLYEKGENEELYSILKKIEGYLLNKESPFPSEYKEGDVIEVIEIKDYEVIDIETFVIDIMITKVIKKEKEF